MNNLLEWNGLFTFIPTRVLTWLLNSPCAITCLFTGNRFGKNEHVSIDYGFRILGIHPNKKKNIVPTKRSRIFRFASQTLPQEKTEQEVKNTQYPAFKRRFPNSLIVSDITSRDHVVSCRASDNENVAVEFVSFDQKVQAGAGVERESIWIDEECNQDFFEEQLPRLMTTGGDIIMTFTPVPGAIGWEFDELYEHAKYIYRTPIVRQRYKDRYGIDYPELQFTDSDKDICVIQAATDDNPIFELIAKEKGMTAKELLDKEFEKYNDEDVVDARRYGIFRQLSGKIYKIFDPSVHVIRYDKTFPNGVDHSWRHFRGIDYHESNPWACFILSVSPQNEIFIWREYTANISKMVTFEIAKQFALRSENYKFRGNYIDPWANKKQSNTALTTVDDLNNAFKLFKSEGIGTGGFWETWETQGTRGREEFNKRLANSMRIGKPFSNLTIDRDGKKHYLPTIWITNNCREIIESMKNWRVETWETREKLQEKDPKQKPQEKYSHYPIGIECLLKNPYVSNAKFGDGGIMSRHTKTYFKRS